MALERDGHRRARVAAGEALPPEDGQQGLMFDLPDLSQTANFSPTISCGGVAENAVGSTRFTVSS